ncbi:MAG: DUF6580 family putative transport protein [Verrucomicrobiota bacterium]
MSFSRAGLSFAPMQEKRNYWLPVVFLALIVLSRWPGLFPPSFSAVYALMFCAGVYFTGRMAWWLPLGTLVLTDIALNAYYQLHGWNVWDFSVLKYQLANYVAYVAIIWMGRRFKPQSSFLPLLGGGVFGALLFYLITNTASWLLNPFNNPEYTKNLAGWLIALIKGTNGWPQTWEFFRNTLLSSGLFTALFVGAMKLTAAAESPVEKEAGVRNEKPENEEAPEEAKA